MPWDLKCNVYVYVPPFLGDVVPVGIGGIITVEEVFYA
jgi:hypothetical protein